MRGLIILSVLHFCVRLRNCNAQQTTEIEAYEKNKYINTSIDISCSTWTSMQNTTLVGVKIEGENVILSDLVDATGSFKPLCNTSANINKTNILIVILSSNRFIIDEDLNGGELNMVVISPRWDVFGNRTISLDGLDGEFDKYLNRTEVLRNITANPGNAGGNFVGIGETFNNGQHLTITTNGGNGSPGLGGNSGAQGRKGYSPLPLKSNHLNCTIAKECIAKGVFHTESTSYLCDFEQYNLFNCSGKWEVDPKTTEETCRFKIYGMPQTAEKYSAGDGHIGGSGGPGGHPGILELIDLSTVSGVSLQNRPGNSGMNGKNGPGGEGGPTGDTLAYLLKELNKEVIHSTMKVMESKERSKDGRPNTMEPERLVNTNLPKEQSLGPALVDRIVKEYEHLLRNSFAVQDSFQEKYVSLFYSQVDSRTYEKRCSRYSIGQLMDELRGLEEDYHKFNKPKDFLVLYESLFHKIRSHAEPHCSGVWPNEMSLKHGIDQKTWETQVRPENMKVLRYMYTATLGRVYSMKDHVDTVVITDIAEYLSSIQKVVQELQQVKGERNKFLMVLSKLNKVNQIKADYGQYIAKKCEEASMLITTQILPEIDNINEETMTSIDLFLEEIAEMKRAKEREIEKLKEKEKELRKAMVANFFFGVLRFIGTAVSFLPVVGPALGASIQVGVSIGETVFNSLNSGDMPELTQLANDFDNYSELSLNNTQQEDGEKTKTEEKPKKAKSTEVAKAVLGVASSAINVAKKYENDKDKLEEVKHQIEVAKDQLESLKTFENNVRSELKPALQNMGASMKSASESLKGKSHASLDITKWRIQSTLKKIMGTLKATTKGFKIQDKMLSCIDKMVDAMNTMIGLFDRIQNYHEQLNLGNFIADVSAASATDVNITNPHFRNITLHLQLMISSNLVLQKYEEAVTAFKQFVFPFAHLYFNGLTLPAQIRVGDSLGDLVNTASTQINHLVKRLDDYKQTIKKQDKMIGVGKFSSKYKSTKPFFVWKNADNRDSISKLLSCEEVVLKSDVKYSPKYEDAIKFNSIQFSLKATEKYKHLQSDLDKVFEKFELKATHMGTSYYRHQSRTYMIMTNSVSFWYNIEKDEEGHPVRRDVSYDKMIRGDYSMSPYAVWKVQLSDLTDDFECNDLRKYADKVDVELEGEGHYVRAGEKHDLRLEMDTYYKSLDKDQPDVMVEKKDSEVDVLMKIIERRSKERSEERKKYKEQKKVEDNEKKIAVEKYREPFIMRRKICDE